ncbi:hypothetical protein E2C01_082176 [Portunus trituberculatus]|uniref:Uncharacterized protein n=1 Tax=Portunus trituberculatus TaxID=210409 RepID=A0A5B7J319_PORTR|nr:hypothetical protein [Portunus trituberculatus]
MDRGEYGTSVLYDTGALSEGCWHGGEEERKA